MYIPPSAAYHRPDSRPSPLPVPRFPVRLYIYALYANELYLLSCVLALHLTDGDSDYPLETLMWHLVCLSWATCQAPLTFSCPNITMICYC
jgi:hypothetical protein